MHTVPESPGAVIKEARQKTGITMEKLAERVGITERYLYRIENEGQKPSYDVFIQLIRELALDPRVIIHPEYPDMDGEVGEILRMLCTCDKRSMEVVKATIRALMDTAPEK